MNHLPSPPAQQRFEQFGPNPSDLKKFSCLPCRQRKIKCDRRNPCSNCTKTSRKCGFVDPVRGKRKRKIAPKEGMHAKLRRYEELLRSYGAEIEPSDNRNVETSDAESEPDVQMVDEEKEESKISATSPYTLDETKTKLISKNGSSRYFDTGLWPNLGDEFHHQIEEGTESLDASTAHGSQYIDNSPQESDLVLGNTPKNEDLATLHFPLHILQALFDIFAERVDPLMKFLHLPSLWPLIRNAVEDTRIMSKSVTAMVFSFYFTTVTCLEEKKCLSLLGEEKSILTARYRNAARQALINADYLKTSTLMTLQAYATYLIPMRGHTEGTSMYILSGISVRLARRMGLHRDGTMLGLSLFETEMRRRLWWHIVQVDWQTSDQSGTKPSLDLFTSDTKQPLNIEDEDMSPDMVDPPPERSGITPLVLSLLRCDIMQFLRKVTPHISTDVGSPLPGWGNLTSPNIPVPEKENLIDGMEDMLERKYLRYFDPSNALHYFSSILARSSVCKMKLLAHNPRQYAISGIKVPQRSRDILFANSMKMLEYASLCLTNDNLRKFTWQVSTGYLWDTLHCVLVEVRERKIGPQSAYSCIHYQTFGRPAHDQVHSPWMHLVLSDLPKEVVLTPRLPLVDRAWQLIELVFTNYPQIFTVDNALYAALVNWTLRVWDEVTATRKTEGLPELPMPEFIALLRHCRRPTAEASSNPRPTADLGLATGNSAVYGEVQHPVFDGNTSASSEMNDLYDFPNLLSFEMEPDEWMQWERLLSGQALA